MSTPPGVAPAGSPPATPPPPPRVTPVPGQPLHELLGQREAAKAQLAEAKARVDTIDKAIKNMLTQANPGVAVIDIAGDSSVAPLRLAWRTPRRLDTERFKAEQKQMYDHYLTWGTPYWELRPIRS
jgi:hypothetical protein